MSRLLNAALLTAALVVPIAAVPTALLAQDHDSTQTTETTTRTYHDRQHNDDHSWNKQEDRAYRSWAKENHRKYREFNRLKDDDQQSYWTWRHEHSDALLHIDIN
jgi:hypothetical protein